MIQRIQTIYILISIICLSIITFGRSILIYIFGTSIEHYEITLYGITNQEHISVKSSFDLPLNILAFLLLPLLLFSIISFKNLKRQSLILKISTLLYSLLIIGVVSIYFFNDIDINTDTTKYSPQLASGFFILCIGLPALILANNGIKRDKKLIDSLNRLR